jgi:hypothetical protein
MPKIRSCTVATLIIFLINPAARAQAITALQACISQNIQNNTLRFSNIQIVHIGKKSGHAKVSGTTLGITCTGGIAKTLWDELRPSKTNTTERPNIDRSMVESIWFGGRSNCSRTKNTPTGDPAPGGDNDYWCSIFLDLPASIMQGAR